MPEQHPVPVVDEATGLRVLGDAEGVQQAQAVAVGVAVRRLQVPLQRLQQQGGAFGHWTVRAASCVLSISSVNKNLAWHQGEQVSWQNVMKSFDPPELPSVRSLQNCRYGRY